MADIKLNSKPSRFALHWKTQTMKNGLYIVDDGNICAGFVIQNGFMTECAPILRYILKKDRWPLKIARWIAP